eukprot:403359861
MLKLQFATKVSNENDKKKEVKIKEVKSKVEEPQNQKTEQKDASLSFLKRVVEKNQTDKEAIKSRMESFQEQQSTYKKTIYAASNKNNTDPKLAQTQIPEKKKSFLNFKNDLDRRKYFAQKKLKTDEEKLDKFINEQFQTAAGQNPPNLQFQNIAQSMHSSDVQQPEVVVQNDNEEKKSMQEEGLQFIFRATKEKSSTALKESQTIQEPVIIGKTTKTTTQKVQFNMVDKDLGQFTKENRYRLDIFINGYSDLEVDQNIQSNQQYNKRLQHSILTLRRLFGLIYFEGDGITQNHRDKAEKILREQMSFALQDYSINISQREYLINAQKDKIGQFQSSIGINQFNMFLLLVESYLKIKRELYANDQMCKAFITEIYEYCNVLLQESKKDPLTRKWAQTKENLKMIEAICNHLNYVDFNFPKSLLKDSEHVKIDIVMPAVAATKDIIQSEEQSIRSQIEQIETQSLEVKEEKLEATEIVIEEESIFQQSNQDQLIIDLKILRDLGHLILRDNIKTLLIQEQHLIDMRSDFNSQVKHTDSLIQSIERAEKKLKSDIFQISKFNNSILQTLNNLATVPNDFYEYFDSIAYFLTRFEPYIDLPLYTDLTFQQIRKLSSRKSENLMFLFRQKMENSYQDVQSTKLARILFILSRSRFPYSEHIFNNIFHQDISNEVHKPLKPLKSYEFASIIPSLSKAKYNNFSVIDDICQQLLKTLKDDFNKIDASYLKVYMERLISLDYRFLDKGLHFAKEIKEIINSSSSALRKVSIEYGAKIKTESERLEYNKKIDTKLTLYGIVEQYCDVIIEQNNPEFKVQLMVDQS